MAVGNAVPPAGDHVLVLSCPDRPGIVHRVAGCVLLDASRTVVFH